MRCLQPLRAGDPGSRSDEKRRPSPMPGDISLALCSLAAANGVMRVLPHTRSCFVCGESNSSGLRLRFETDGRRVQTRFVPGPDHAGFKQTVHGGITATVLDEIMVWACAVATRRFAYCAELNVRFLQPLRPGEEALVTGELVNNRRDKLFEGQSGIARSFRPAACFRHRKVPADQGNRERGHV